MQCSRIKKKECWNTENMIANICIASYLKCFSYLNSPFDAVFSRLYFSTKWKKSSKKSSKFRTFFPFPKNVSKELFCFIQWKSVCDNPKSNIDNPTFPPLKLSTTHLLICREHQNTMAKIDLYRKWALLYLKACHWSSDFWRSKPDIHLSPFVSY